MKALSKSTPIAPQTTRAHGIHHQWIFMKTLPQLKSFKFLCSVWDESNWWDIYVYDDKKQDGNDGRYISKSIFPRLLAVTQYKDTTTDSQEFIFENSLAVAAFKSVNVIWQLAFGYLARTWYLEQMDGITHKD